jgi:5-methylcytosine-specific restriction endonuclease McrA
MSNYFKFGLRELKRIFGSNIATKTVTLTDKTKDAYFVTVAQKKVLENAGFTPGINPNPTTVPLNILGTGDVVEASYYGSQRVGSGRPPEYRMGRFLVGLNIGDEIALATDGRDVFLCIVSRDDDVIEDVRTAYEDTAVSANERLSREDLMTRVKQVKPNPDARTVETKRYNSAPAIKAFAHNRSAHKCEMPRCEYEGFNKYSGGKFIEIHHIKPLSEDGDDSIINVAALCPNCHRKMHHARDRVQLARILKAAVKQANKEFGIE